MDTNVQDVNQNALIDLFPEIGDKNTLAGKSSFSMEQVETDIFGNPKSATGETTLASATGETTLSGSATGETTLSPSATGETTLTPTGEADMFGDDGKAKPAAATTLSDLSTYYQDRIKNGKFVAIEEEDEKGNKIPFIPKTAEEYDEVLELQINYRLDQAKKDLEKKWYESKSPAWKAVSQYAEMVDDPAQLIPFLTGVRNLQSVATLNENEVEGAETIIRTRMEQRGDPEEVINSQIEALKSTDKLIATAKQMKPIIIQQEQLALQKMQQQEQQQQQEYLKIVTEVRANAIKAIEAPIFGKQKLKQEEKAAVYDLIGEPSEETQGYGIYNAIDALFDKKDFETLKEVALLLSKKDSFYGYLGTTVANQTHAALEKKLRLAGESHKSSGNDFTDEDMGKAVVTRNQFNKKPSFGRG